jgi:hypothetical protein
MIIKGLLIKEFKGIDEMSLEFSGHTVIKGDIDNNKTSILDAIHFLFIGKNIDDEKQFPVFPIHTEGPKQGQLIPNKEPYVQGHIVLDDGTGHVLERKLNKKNGDTELKIDGYDMTVGKFQDFISENIIEFESFRLFFNPNYFTGLDPKKARDVFVSKFGEVKPEAVIAKSRDYQFTKTFIDEIMIAKAPMILDKYKSEVLDITREKAEINAKMDSLEEQIAAAGFQEDENMQTLKKRKGVIEGDISKFNSSAIDYNAHLSKKQSVLNELSHYRTKLESLTGHIDDTVQNKIARLGEDKGRLSIKLGNLREEYKKLVATRICTHNCPTCHTPLTGDMLLNAKENIRISIQDNMDGGKMKNKEIADIDKELSELKKARTGKTDDIDLKVAEGNVKDSEVELMNLESSAPAHPGDITELTKEFQEIARKIGGFDEIKRMQGTIGQYTREQKELSISLEKSITIKNDATKFINAQAQFLVENVNSKFKHIKIELFKKLKNGDMKDTFIISLDGVPHQGLNNGGKMIAGLEIQMYFKQYSQNSIPVLIDRYESYEAIDISEYLGDSQVIVTVVEKDALFEVINS